MLMTLLASLLRIGGALGGVMAVYLIKDATLAEGLAAAGLADQVSIPMARMAAHAFCGCAGFIIMSQIAGLVMRGPRTPHGTRQDAAEAVPRLRRHLTEGGRTPAPSSLPDYLDPDPAPTKPVGVSFKELGLEQPHVSEYPAPRGESSGESDDFVYRDEFERPESAGSASDEWDDPTPEPQRSAPPPQAVPASELPPACESPRPVEPQPEYAEPTVEPARAERAPMMAEPAYAESPASQAPLPTPEPEEEVALTPAEPVMSAEPVAEPEIERQSSMPHDLPHTSESHPSGPAPFGAWAAPAAPEPVASTRESVTPLQPAAQMEPEPEIVRPGPVGLDDYSRPSFAMPTAGGDADWYDGAGDDEEEAEDDGAGYGSLSSIGLGRNHAAKVETGQRGEAGLPPALYSSGGYGLVPKGKPQDFRLREALAELRRLDETSN